MSEHAGAAKSDFGIDLPAHEETYAGFVSLTENLTIHILNILLLLVLWGLGARAVSALVRKTLLRPVDRLLGAVFGLARGVLVLLVLAMVVSYTPASASPAWRESQGARWLNSILGQLVPSLLPVNREPAARSV